MTPVELQQQDGSDADRPDSEDEGGSVDPANEQPVGGDGEPDSEQIDDGEDDRAAIEGRCYVGSVIGPFDGTTVFEWGRLAR